MRNYWTDGQKKEGDKDRQRDNDRDRQRVRERGRKKSVCCSKVAL